MCWTLAAYFTFVDFAVVSFHTLIPAPRCILADPLPTEALTLWTLAAENAHLLIFCRRRLSLLGRSLFSALLLTFAFGGSHSLACGPCVVIDRIFLEALTHLFASHFVFVRHLCPLRLSLTCLLAVCCQRMLSPLACVPSTSLPACWPSYAILATRDRVSHSCSCPSTAL